MKGLLAMARGIDASSAIIGKGSSWLLLLAILISACNAIARKLFSLSSNAWLEAQWYLFSATFLLAAAYTLRDNEHVRVDLVFSKLGRRTQLRIEIFGILFFLLPFCVITLWLAWPIALTKIATGEVSSNPGGLIIWPVWILIPVGFLLLALQGVSELVKRLAVLSGYLPERALSPDSPAIDV